MGTLVRIIVTGLILAMTCSVHGCATDAQGNLILDADTISELSDLLIDIQEEREAREGGSVNDAMTLQELYEQAAEYLNSEEGQSEISDAIEELREQLEELQNE